MSLDEFAKRIMNDPDADDDDKRSISALMTSHLTSGMRLQQQGLLYEAITEFSKENNRPIHSDIDKEIVEKSYCHIGEVYRKLGEIEKAKEAFQQARDLFIQFHKGVLPHEDLVQILIEEGKLNEAIEVCKEYVELFPRKPAKQLLEEVMSMRKGRSDI